MRSAWSVPRRRSASPRDANKIGSGLAATRLTLVCPTRASAPLVGVAALFLLACSSNVDDARTIAPSGSGAETGANEIAGAPFAIAWGSCTIPTYGSGAGIEAECATVDAPARRGVDGSGTTPVAVYRLASKTQPARAQLWLLTGGPGAAGFGLAPAAVRATSRFQGVDVYLLDHRGTGASALLECPEAQATATSMSEYMRACSREVRRVMGDAIDGFSTTEVAHDIRELIDSTAHADQKVFVYGVSYGSYLVHRLVQLPATRIDGVITDGNCIGELCSFDTPQAFRVDEAVKHVMDVCRDTPECRARLGADPWSFTRTTLDMLARGHCSGSALTLLATADWAAALGVHWPAGIAPTLHRLRRCSAADIAVLDTLAGKLVEIRGGGFASTAAPFGPTPRPTRESEVSGPLMYHVAASEMIPRPAPSPTVLAERGATFAFKADPHAFDVTYFDHWEGYPRDAYAGTWAKRDLPWLMLQGTFDFQTEYSLAERARDHLPNPSLQLVRVDGGGHGVAFSSECSLEMLDAFIVAPRAKVDTTCLASVRRASLVIEPSYTEHFFGTADAWDDPQ